MNFLTAIIDGLVRFVQRNPLTTLVILILAIGVMLFTGLLPYREAGRIISNDAPL